MDHVVRTINVVNDVAERSTKLLQDFSGKMTKDDIECQGLLQSIEQHKKPKLLPKNNLF